MITGLDDTRNLSAFETHLDSLKLLVEESLKESLLLNATQAPMLKLAMEYSLMAKAKRIRPILALLAGRMFGSSDSLLLDVGVAIEHLHTYSLIHDDLPCMDNTDYRRGLLTCHKKFGDDIATLAGDALLTLAWDTIINQSRKHGVDEKRILDIVQVLSEAVGANGMIAGQVLDLQAEGKELPLDEVCRIHELKTGKLFTGSLLVGAILGQASQKDLKNLRDFGTCFGLVFQITDDILDITATSAELGKPTGNDQKLMKSTVPSILGVEGSRDLARTHVERGKKVLKTYRNTDAEFLSSLLDYLLIRVS
mgnify:CR=1 FL=1